LSFLKIGTIVAVLARRDEVRRLVERSDLVPRGALHPDEGAPDLRCSVDHVDMVGGMIRGGLGVERLVKPVQVLLELPELVFPFGDQDRAGQ
jgi:hypothetical protein